MQEISFRLLFGNIITMWVHSKQKHPQKHKNIDLQNTFEAQLDTFNLNLELDTEKLGTATTHKLQLQSIAQCRGLIIDLDLLSVNPV